MDSARAGVAAERDERGRRVKIAEVRDAIGHQRPAWVQTARGEVAILVRAGRMGDAALIRYAEGDAGYHWVDASWLTRRDDLDGNPEPMWLRQARTSHRPPSVLWDILNPDYSDRAITERARADADRLLDETHR